MKNRYNPTLLTYHLAAVNRASVRVPKSPSRLMSSPVFTLVLVSILTAVLLWALNGSPWLPFLSE